MLDSSQQEVPPGGVAGTSGAVVLCAQQLQGGWNSRRGLGAAAGWHTVISQQPCRFPQQVSYQVVRGAKPQMHMPERTRVFYPKLPLF